ncbi:MAG TPA: hypothetical protein VJV76_04715 [Gaiellaceae bacterium]|nr:hypothetical protein [Gaiellaceae bacterium]
MPMLHSCTYTGCDTLTLSPYCFEHERVVRSEVEAERTQIAARDEPTARELAAVVQPAT